MNNPGPSAKQKSPVWTFFEIWKDDTSKAKCILCEHEKLISRGGSGKNASTSPLLFHLRNSHKNEYDSMMTRRQAKAIQTSTAFKPKLEKCSTGPGAKQKSPVWKFFEIWTEDTSKAKCILCKHEKLISRGGSGKNASTSPLLFHLRHSHKNEYDSMMTRRQGNAIKTSTVLKQPKLEKGSTYPRPGAKQKSPVWKFFEIWKDDTSKAKCTLCKHEKLISRGGSGKNASTSPLLFHLRNSHKNEYDSMMSRRQANSIKTSTALKQPKLEIGSTDSIRLWDVDDTRAVKYHYLIGEMIAVDNQPISFVEDLGFKRLMSKALPHYEVPSRHYFSDKIIPDVYQRVRNKIQEMVNKTSSLSLTSDIWTCPHNNESFISISGHFIISESEFEKENNMKKHHVVLSLQSFRGSHTDLNIAEKITNTLDSWYINKTKIHLMLIDSAQNMKKGCNDCGLSSENCFIHCLQLVVTDSLKVQRVVTDTIATSRNIVEHFSHSAVEVDKLRNIQSDLGMDQKKLVQDVSTRWDSSFYMLERLFEQKSCIDTYANENSAISNLTKNQWDIVEGLIQILRPFEEITKQISAADSIISDVIPCITMLKRYLDESSVFELGSLKASLEEGLEHRFSDIERNKNYYFATILDPRYKLKFFSTTDSANLSSLLLHIRASLVSTSSWEAMGSNDSNTTVNNDPNLSTSSPPKKKSIWSCYNEIASSSSDSEYFTNQTACLEERNIDSEIESYLLLPLMDRESCPISWWGTNQSTFPYLASLATQYLSAPASSVYREPLFSEGGNIYEDTRNRLRPRNAETLFIQHNLPKLDFDY